MSLRRSFFLLGFSALLIAPAANAQQAKPAAPAPGVPQSAAAVPATQVEPVLPEPQDPLLAPVPPPQNVLSSWQQALKIVRDQNVNLRFARANILLAEGQLRAALAPALPQLVGTAGVTKYLLKGEVPNGAGGTANIPNPSTYWNAALNLTVPIFRPSVWYDRGSAKENVEAQQLNQREAERQVIAGVANLIVSVVTAERLAEVSRTSLKAALSTVDLTRRRATLGASNTLDVLRVEGEASQARAQVVGTTEAVIRAREALGTALGSPQPWGVTQDIQVDGLMADAQRVCQQETDVNSRSDVRAASASVGVADRQVKSVDYRYLPTLDGLSTLGVQDPNFAVNNRAVNWTIGALLTWNIYDGGLRGAQRTQAKANLQVAEANLADAKRNASLQVQQAIRNVQVAEANLAVSAKTREINAETARLQKVSFLNGSGTSFDLVLTERQLREAEADLAVKEFDVMQAKIAALLALSNCKLP